MKIAIHDSKCFSSGWIRYCEKNNISYKIVDCYDTNIIQQVQDCEIILWDHHQGNHKDVLFAKQLLYSLEQSGKSVFPDFYTNWHFDDKVGQKYLLESIGAPIVPSYVFYSKTDAIEWIQNAKFPLVFKLRSGAGASHVKLIKSVRAAKHIIEKSFSSGFSKFDKWGYFIEQVRKARYQQGNVLNIVKGLGRLILSTEFARRSHKEKGYVYFQDFIPGNNFDIRIIVINEKAFAIKRLVRQNDFRASGSGRIIYDNACIDLSTIKIAFEITEKLKVQCVAYDFVYNENRCPLIIEISYAFTSSAYDKCPGYWDKNLVWHVAKINPEEWMIESVIAKYKLLKKNEI